MAETPPAGAVPGQIPTDSEARSEDRVAWFREAKLGLVIHWGLYSAAAGVWKGAKYYGIGEWLMQRAKVPTHEYERLATVFHPVRFDARQWVAVAKAAGARYLVITSKHHDGFAMYHSQASPFNIVDATPFRRDPMQELAEACREAGIRFCFYYSQYQDWHEPGGGGNTWEFPNNAERFTEYFETKCKLQVKEILTQYGPLGLIWFDTPGPMTREQSQELVDLVRSLQPDCLVSGRVGNDAGDFMDLGDHEMPTERMALPWETPFTHNDSWGYVWYDENWRSTRELVRMLVRVNGKGGNLLLNAGPRGDGTLPEESVRVLRRVGEWIESNAEAVYGTSASPFPELAWGECTARAGVLYLHVFAWPEDRHLRLPGLSARIRKVAFLVGGRALAFRKEGIDWLITLPERMPDPTNTVLRVDYDGALDVDPVRVLMPGCRNTFSAPEAALSGKARRRKTSWMEEFGNWHHAHVIEGWTAPEDAAAWTFRVAEPGRCRVVVNYSHTARPRREMNVQLGGHTFWFETQITGCEPWHFHTKSVGVVSFPEAGVHQLRVHPAGAGDEALNLRDAILEPFE